MGDAPAPHSPTHGELFLVNGGSLFFVYILRSVTTGQFYVGHCDNLVTRFREHQDGIVKDTRGRGPWWMPYFEIYHSISDAQEREQAIRAKKSSRYIRTIIYAAFPLMELD